jgi:hypothetical protein
MTPFKKNEIWWLRLVIVVVVITSFSLITITERRVSEQLTQLQTKIDSLESELFIQKTITGRYELTINHFIENKKLDSIQVDDYLNHETE